MNKRVSKLATVSDQPNLPLLSEARLGPLYHSFMGHSPVALISVMNDTSTVEENLQRARELMDSLSIRGFETMRIEGAWRTSSADSGRTRVPDHCVWVVDVAKRHELLIEEMIGCAGRYGQNGFLIASQTTQAPPRPSNTREVSVLDAHGVLVERIERATLESMVDAYRFLRRPRSDLEAFEFEQAYPGSPHFQTAVP